MAHKRGVYHRRKHNLKTLFPANHEQYLCLTFSLEETVLMRMIICNENLAERPEIWAYAGERVKNTPIRAAFGTLNKQDYLVFLAVDRFNKQGLSSYVSIHTAKQFVMAVEMLVQEFEQEVLNNGNIEALSNDGLGNFQVVNFDGLGNTQVVDFTPTNEDEISSLYN